MKKIKTLMTGLAATLAGLTALPLVAMATPSTVVVRPSNTQGWSTSDTRANGHVSFVADNTSPLPQGALSLVTDASPASGQDKAQYLHAANTPIADVTQLGYSAKQNAASFADGTASYQLVVNLTGTSGFTTFVYEPYENGNTMVNGAWQTYDVDAGQMWSSKSFTDGGCSVSAGFGGAPFYTLSAIKSMCPNAVVIGFGVNVGSNNPGYNIEADAVVFNDTTYNFELDLTYPKTKDDCKNNGWKTFTGVTFKNQGKCIDYVRDHSPADYIKGVLTMSGPSQKVKFNVSDHDWWSWHKKDTVEYWNYDYPGGLHYKANVLCVGGDKSLNEARVMFQIPAGHPGLSGLYVVAYVKEVKHSVGQDLYGHAATADLTTAQTWCNTGAGFAPTMYPVTHGNVYIN